MDLLQVRLLPPAVAFLMARLVMLAPTGPPARRRNLAWLLGLGVIAALAGCRSHRLRTPSAAAKPPPAAARLPEVSVDFDTRITGADLQGHLLWTAHARRSVLRGNPPSTDMQGVTWTLLRNGRPAWYVQASRLQAAQATRQITMSGGVTGRSADGGTGFKAPSVVWDSTRQTFTGTGRVEFRLGAFVAFGNRLVYHTPDGAYTLDGPGTGRLPR